MSDTALHRDTKTLADYEAFVATQPEETRWELIGGQLFSMTTRPSPISSCIAVRTETGLSSRIRS